MFSLKVLNFYAKRKTAGTPNLQAVIVNGQTHSTACLRIVSVTERVDQCFPESNRREEGFIYALEKPGFDSS